MTTNVNMVTPTDRIVIMGEAPIKTIHNVESGTGLYPGKVAQKGTTGYDIVVGTGAGVAPKGFAAYEDTPSQGRPDTKTTAYETGKTATVIRGPGFVLDAYLAPNFVAAQDDALFSFGSGNLAPGKYINGVPAIKIPFVKATAEQTTGITLPAGVSVTGAVVEVATAAGSATIDVGILSSESGGDADGFLDGVSCATAGLVVANLADASAANITLGALLTEAQLVSDVAGPTFAVRKFPGYVTDGTAKTITYTTSNHTIAGNIYVLVDAPGIVQMGVAEEAVTAGATAARIHVRSV